eukprot:m.65100 g.65100  ORF g.65100 m.65100 type:complete len:360 (-) comp17942_c2_seq1:49-1128(-)
MGNSGSSSRRSPAAHTSPLGRAEGSVVNIAVSGGLTAATRTSIELSAFIEDLYSPSDGTLSSGKEQSSGTAADFLALLPIELAAQVAKFLTEADIMRVRRVCREWNQVANSELVWKHLTQLRWPTLCRTPRMVHSWKDAHKIIWLGSRVANRDGASEGYSYFAAYGFVQSQQTVTQEASLLDSCLSLEPKTIGFRLAESVVEEDEVLRSTLMEAFMKLQNFKGVFLPEAMRRLFAKARFPGHSSLSIAPVLRYFIGQYIRDNPGGAPGTNRPCLPDGDERINIHTLCYAIILLSVDLYNDNVKSKMTRREFIRNNAFMAYTDEYLMRIYDNVYMWGHIAEPKRTSPRHELGRKNIDRLL